jgi:hypothetical protein
MWSDLVVLMPQGVIDDRIDTVRVEHSPEAMGRDPRVDRHGGEVYVYRRHEQGCLVCGTPIRLELHAARNLYWCPRCQPSGCGRGEEAQGPYADQRWPRRADKALSRVNTWLERVTGVAVGYRGVMTLDAPREVRTGRSVAEVYDYGAHVWSWALDGSRCCGRAPSRSSSPGRPCAAVYPSAGPGSVPAAAATSRPRTALPGSASGPSPGGSRARRHGPHVRPHARRAPDALPGRGLDRVTYEVSVGNGLELALTVANLGVTPFSYETALHTYLRSATCGR